MNNLNHILSPLKRVGKTGWGKLRPMLRVVADITAVRRAAEKLPRRAWLAMFMAGMVLTSVGLYIGRAHADSQGPLSASSTSDCTDDTGVGTVTWTSPGNAFSVNTTYATASVDGTTTHYIKCMNYGFSIPTGSTINGIVVSVTRKSSSTSNGGSSDAAMRLVQGGTVQTTDRSTTTIFTTSDVSEVHGTSTDLWGGTWAASDINASTFGAAYAAQKASSAGAAHTVSVDAVQITVYYTPPVTAYTQGSYRIFGNQDASSAATFVKSLGGSSNDYGYSTAKTTDGGYVVTGETNSFGAGGTDMFLAKYDASGTLSWSKTWGGTAYDTGRSVIQTSDGGYAVTGYTFSYGDITNGDMFIAKFTSTGTLSWSKTWGSTAPEYGNSITQLSDGGYVVTGETDGLGVSSTIDMFVAKYNSSGTFLWSRTWGGVSDDYGAAVTSTSDGGFAVTGTTKSFGDTTGDMFLAKYDASGNLSWSKTWGGTGSDNGDSLVQTSDGGYVVTGNTTSYGDTVNGDMFLARYTSAGALSWSKTWGGTGTEVGHNVVQAADGGYAVTGNTSSFGAGGTDMFVAKYDSSGVFSWSKTWGTVADDQGNSLFQSGDGSYVVAGYTIGGSSSDILLAKLSSSGSIAGCSSPSCKTDGTDYTSTRKADTVGGGSDYTSVRKADTVGGGSDYTSTTNVLVALAPSVDVGSPLATINTAATVPGDSQAFRVRVDIAVSSAGVAANGQSFKLQYAALSGGSCSATPTGNYADVTDTSTVQYYDNSLASSGQGLSTNANDPTDGTNTPYTSSGLVRQTYQEKHTSTFTNPTAITAGQDGMWDFALTTYHTLQNTHYCLRIVKSTGSALNTYTNYPEIVTPASTYSQDSYRVFSPGSASSTLAETWGGASSDTGYAVVQTSDGGYAAAGNTSSYGAGGGDATLAKFTSTGTLSWSKTWGGTGTETTTSMVQTSDGGYAVTGYTTSFGAGSNDIFLLKFTSTGTLSWSKTWGGTVDEYGYSVVQTSDGGYAVGGNTTSFGAGGSDIFLLKFTSTGTLSWSKTWGGTSDEYGYSVVQTSDGGYAMTGYTTNFGAGGSDAVLLKFTSTGTLSWSKTWGGSSTDVGNFLVQTSDGGYAVTGYTTSFGAGTEDMILLKFTSTGTLSWSKTWGGTNYDRGSSVVQTTDGGYAVAGYTQSFGGGGEDAALVKFTSTGTLSWNKTWGGAGSDRGNSVVQANDGGYAVGGYTSSLGAGSYDLVFLKYDGSGYINGCTTACTTPVATVLADTVGGGSDYTSTSKADTVGGGTDYTSTSKADTVGGGTDYTSTSKADTVGGGTDYTSTSKADTVGGGTDYTSTTTGSVALGTSAAVGTPIVPQNTPYDSLPVGNQLRLRLDIGVSGSGTALSGQAFKLQFATRGTAASCSAVSSGSFADVTTSTAVKYYDGAGNASGDGVNPSTNDPTDGSNTLVPQTYAEANNFTNAISVLYSGQSGVWDFSLAIQTSASLPTTDFCFRAVKSTGTLLDTYNNFVELAHGPADMTRLLGQGAWWSRSGARQNLVLHGQ